MTDDKEVKPRLLDMSKMQEIVEFSRNNLKEQQPSDNYRQLLELTLILGGVPP